MKKHYIFILIVVAFLAIRLPGISLPYYQDEWKNVASSKTAESAGEFFSHPPFMQMWFVSGHELLGENNFRIFPLIFSLATTVMAYVLLSRRDKKQALFVSFLLLVSFYSIWSSLMTDVDGSVLPLLFLAGIYVYEKFTVSVDRKKWQWLAALFLICLTGMLVKLSFAIVVGVFIFDYLIDQWKAMTVKKFSLVALCGVIFSVIYVALLYIIQAFYPAYSIDFMLSHADQFTAPASKDYVQILVQGVKALYYLSPLLIIPLIFVSKEIFRKTRIYFLYLILGFVFYFGIFDFSHGALDKYLMFTILPLAVICGTVFAKIFDQKNDSIATPEISSWKSYKWPLILSAIIFAALIAVNFIPSIVVPLYPKTEWFSMIFRGHWNVLTPFNGGSGPLGFYISFLPIALSFIISFIAALIGIWKKQWRPACAMVIIAAGLAHNAVFAEELMFGKINGSASDVLKSSVDFIAQNTSIKQVLSYNDIGNHELSDINKFAGRFYAAPMFEEGHRQKFADFKGQYLVVDISHINENSFYGNFFARCSAIFETFSGKISARVYNCPNSKKIIDTIE